MNFIYIFIIIISSDRGARRNHAKGEFMPVGSIGGSVPNSGIVQVPNSAFKSPFELIRSKNKEIKNLQERVFNLERQSAKQLAKMKQTQACLSMSENQNTILKGLLVASIAIAILVVRR